MPPSPLQVVLVDDSVAIRVGLPVMLPQLDFVATLPDVESLAARRPLADVVALDLRLVGDDPHGRLQGSAAVRAVAAMGYRVCLYSDERRRFVLAQCLRAGAHGAVHKSDPAEVVADAFARVAAGETVITQSLVGLAELVDRRGGMPQLTQRQRQVLTARARGESWSSIARRLFITESVAREHLAAASAKFAAYLQGATPADLERQLGIGPGDLLDGERSG
ncbi:LuxR C-terminal-related transcriptional regulator [Arsenicicoccus dermatophilus]|uniref:LuxR C-terminal-related transcriptional regulator n=1 Tax=Arsenicicoccus dermatophilus TaxID=1076331 RepID=UPI003917135A